MHIIHVMYRTFTGGMLYTNYYIHYTWRRRVTYRRNQYDTIIHGVNEACHASSVESWYVRTYIKSVIFTYVV